MRLHTSYHHSLTLGSTPAGTADRQSIQSNRQMQRNCKGVQTEHTDTAVAGEGPLHRGMVSGAASVFAVRDDCTDTP
jgi:hypothetical protein